MPTLTNTSARRAEDFADTDCILITEAGIEALTSALTVPDELDELDENAEEAADTFTPDTAEKANWVLGKMADARARAARIRENAEMMARAEDREADALEWRFGPALQTFLRAEVAGGKRKSVRLYNGVLGYRQKPVALQVTDPAAALEWARVNLPVAVVSSVDKKALAETLLTTGEAVDFARLLPAGEVFYIK